MFVCVCVCVYVWAAVSAGLSLAVPAFLTLYVIVTVLDELNIHVAMLMHLGDQIRSGKTKKEGNISQW